MTNVSLIHILIVEDEAIVAEDLANRLQKMNYRVAGIAATGEDAIALATQTLPDLVLMDIKLQGKMDGITAAAYIRDRLNLPVIYLTAYADTATLERAKATVPFGYIIKPFKDKELQITIEIALSRHRTEQELQQALSSMTLGIQPPHSLSPMQPEYWSMASHDFRTPLSVIQATATLLQDCGHSWSDEKKQIYLQRIRSAADTMTHLLDDIMTLGRVDTPHLQLMPGLLDLVTFCEELLESFQWSAGDRYHFQLLHTGNCSEVWLDEKLIWHLLNNLLSNATKYSVDGGRVLLQITGYPSEIVIHVQDWGIGIPEDSQHRLFEPFHRASNVGNIPGTGLGLAIAKRVVDLHQGTITVDSDEGKGTLFTVTLPRLAPPLHLTT